MRQRDGTVSGGGKTKLPLLVVIAVIAILIGLLADAQERLGVRK